MKAPIHFFVFALLIASCESIIPDGQADDHLLDGPVSGLSPSEHAKFLAGDVAFNDEVFTIEKGLGPLFVATSCASCHAGDGKGHPFSTLTRFGQVNANGNTYLSQGGPQLQNHAIPGHLPETIPAGATSSKLTPPANTGLGFLAALTDAQILSNADPNDANGDGISGTPNYVSPPEYFHPNQWHQPYEGKYVGRFGKKGAAVDLLHQTANAYNQDIGITSTFSPVDASTGLSSDPEVDDNTVQNVVFYLKTLKAPIQRHQDDEAVKAGKNLFVTIGCASCHTPSWTTGIADIPALSHQTFYPYSDLLLHDMGPGLDDGYTEGQALTAEWKTPPLWGLGLSPQSQGGKYYLLHDGRARSIEEAIELHGGESQATQIRFQELATSDREALLKFLESL